LPSYFHITRFENVEKIMTEGLIPSVGPRSSLMENEAQGVYLFTSQENMETALGGWLGECFDDADTLCVLQVDLDGDFDQSISSDVAWEVRCDRIITPEHIKFFAMEDEITDTYGRTP